MLSKKYTLSPDQVYRLFLWTPFDKRFEIHLPDTLKDELNGMTTFYLDECYVRPTKPADELKGHLTRIQEKPIIVMAFSGIGKSTLLYATLKELESEREQFTFNIDVLSNNELEIPNKIKKLISETLPNAPLTTSVISLMLDKIYHTIGISYNHNYIGKNINDISERDNGALREKLGNILDNIQTHFQVPDECIGDIGFSIHKFLAGDSLFWPDVTIGKLKSYLMDVSENVYSKLCEIIRNSKNIKRDLEIFLLRLLSDLLICENSHSNDGKLSHPSDFNCVIAFDNIEHFINNDVLYDDEICLLFESLEDFLREQQQNPSYSRIFKEDNAYSRHFKIVICAREVSAVMCQLNLYNATRAVDESGDPIRPIVQLSNQIDFLEILKKKREFFKKHLSSIIEIPSCQIDRYNKKNFVDIIIDILSDNGLNDTLSKLNSYNKRRILRNTLHLLEDSETKNYYAFLELLRKADNAERHIYINAARRQIVRQHFSSVNQSGYFDLIEPRSECNDIARRLLVILSRKTMVTDQDSLDSLYDIMNLLFVNPSMQHNIDALKQYAKTHENRLLELASVINGLRERDSRYNWVPLILLKLNLPGAITTKDILNVLREICDKGPDVYNESTGIKITVAGRKFIELNTDFEYFSVRYTASQSLYSTLLNQPNNSLKIVKEVSEHAIASINKINELIEQFVRIDKQNGLHYNLLYNNGSLHPKKTPHVRYLYRRYDIENGSFSGMELTHGERIIISHIRYIDNFRIAILTRIEMEDDLRESYKVDNVSYFEDYEESSIKEHLLSILTDKRNLDKVLEASKMSYELLKIIGNYIDVLWRMTSKESNGQYLIGGPQRNQREDFLHEKYRYPSIKEDYNKALINPLMKLFILPDRDEV